MDIHQLNDAVRRYFAAALARSTHKTYAAVEHCYLNFCKDFNLISLPVSESTLCYYVACLGQQGLAHSSISTYLSGIRQVQISHGFGDPHLDRMSRLRQVLKGVRVEAGKEGRAPRSRLPITPAILQKLRVVWLHSEPLFNSKMLWAASTVTFFFLQIERNNQGLKRGLVVSKRLIEVYIWLVVKCVNMIRAS